MTKVETSEVIGQRYLILRQLREGPWGEVWLAQDNLLRTEVALKLWARDDPQWAAGRDMFEKEAILGLKLRHPHILGVFHVEKAERFLYLVEEPFLGVSLMSQFNQKKRSDMSQALDLLERLGEALACAHQQGVVHQSLSPYNILLKEEDIRLANFAFAPTYDDDPLHLELKAYVPPEVIQGDRLTPAGNVFSLGVLGFRLVAGSLPYALTFDEPFPYRLEYPPVDLEEIPVPLQNVLLRCLSEDPEERLPHAGAVVTQLRQARELMRGVSKEPYASSRPERLRARWAPLAQAKPRLKKIWEDQKPRAQKAKDTALTHFNNLKQVQVPRRYWWGAGLAVLVIGLIIGGIKLGNLATTRSEPARPVASANLPPVGGGPPLVETGETGPSRRAAPAGRMATGSTPPPGPMLASPKKAAREAREERYLLKVATFTSMKQAAALQHRLRAKHLHAFIIKRKSGSKTLYQVEVGPITGAKEAQAAANRIKTQVRITPKIVKLSSRTHHSTHVRRPSR